MKYYYWIALAILVFLIAYTVANKDSIVMEHLTSSTAGPMNAGTGPAPAGSSSSKKCYDKPVDFTSGKFLAPGSMIRAFNTVGTSLPKDQDTPENIAKKMGNTQSLAEAQATCSKNPECKGIIYWDGSTFTGGGDFSWFSKNITPYFKGYTPYAGDATLMQNIKHEGPGTFLDGDNKRLSPGSWTFAPVVKCPASSSEESGDAGGEGECDGDVAALTSKLTALQKEVDDMKKQSKDQMSQAAAAQASLQSIT